MFYDWPSDRAKVVSQTFVPPRHGLPSYAGTPVYTSDVVLAREEAIHHLTFIFLQTAGPDHPQIQRLGSLSKESVTGLSCSVACQA